MKPMNGHFGLISLPSTSESPFDCSTYHPSFQLIFGRVRSISQDIEW